MTEESVEIDGLVEHLLHGDQQVLASLFSRYKDRLRRMIELRLDARLRSRVSASDVVQEAYLDALKRLPHFQADSTVPFFVWLRTVTVQRLIQVHRQHLGAKGRDAAKAVQLRHGVSNEASTDHMAELLGDVTSPSQAAQRGETLARLRETLDNLDAIDREVLALRHFEELSNQEVALVLGIQTAAASKRYVRAIERLKDALEHSPGFRKQDR
jgi:RNA polymerase sigma-70 factor (ECF subfamily)